LPINRERNYCGARENRRSARGNPRTDIWPKREVSHTLEPHLPKRLTKQFVALALATPELVQEILKVIGRRLFVAFQPKEPCDVVVAGRVNFTANVWAVRQILSWLR
jgi:hypothetical protein